MILIRLDATTTSDGVLVCPILAGSSGIGVPLGQAAIAADAATEADAYLTETAHSGKPGQVEILPRPLRQPSKIYLAGIGGGAEGDWRAAGAAIARAAAKETEVSVLVPGDLTAAALGGLAEGLWLGEYAFRYRAARPDEQRTLHTVTVLVQPSPQLADAIVRARVIATWTNLARDLTNTPSAIKTPAWFVEQAREHAPAGVTLAVRDPEQLAEEGFGGILAVGAGSVQTPRLLELGWNPPGATEHIVLVGKGITFDTGGIDIKPVDAMQLMRKDMGAAAAVVGAIFAAADLNLGVRVTVLAPLAENMVSGSAWRSGDVVRHYGGLTSEVHSTDAEGRVVVADAMAYAVACLEPDLLLDLATLTGASRIALGFRTAALFSDNPDLIDSLSAAADQAGEQIWHMPLADDYMSDVVAEIADLNNAAGNPGAITAALYLREFAGPLRDRWAHIDMSAPAWSAKVDGELAKGATGWGVRTLVRWLASRNT